MLETLWRAPGQDDMPVSPADVCATIYECLGIDPEMTVRDRGGRPVPVANGGQPLRAILA